MVWLDVSWYRRLERGEIYITVNPTYAISSKNYSRGLLQSDALTRSGSASAFCFQRESNNSLPYIWSTNWRSPGNGKRELSPDSPSQLIPTRVNNTLDSKMSEYLKRRMLSSASCARAVGTLCVGGNKLAEAVYTAGSINGGNKN